MAIGSAAAAYAAPPAPGQTRMGGHTYLFEPDLFEGGVVETGNVRSALLKLTWPDMKGVGLAAQIDPSGQDRTLLILANSAATTAGDAAPPNYVAGGIRDELKPTLSLDPLAPFAPQAASDLGQGKSPGGGMVKLASGRMAPTTPALDVWALPPIDNPSQFILCGRVGGIFRRSSCSQFFVANDLILKVSYSHDLLDQWRSIHEGIVSFLGAHEVR